MSVAEASEAAAVGLVMGLRFIFPTAYPQGGVARVLSTCCGFGATGAGDRSGLLRLRWPNSTLRRNWRERKRAALRDAGPPFSHLGKSVSTVGPIQRRRSNSCP